MPIQTPWIGRRQFAAGVPAAALSLLLPGRLMAQTTLVASPRQTEGPFYPEDWQGDIDSDLVRVSGAAARAIGQVVHVSGRVLDVTGEPVRGATVEIWQCDAQGIYRHSRDERTSRQRDAGFQGRGRATSDAAGRYHFRTIRPVAYGARTPHIHFKVEAPDRNTLITQMYVFGEPRNDDDGILNGIRDRRQRDSVIVRLDAADALEAGALTGSFDIVMPA